MSLIAGLRRQIIDFKHQMKKKDEELEKLKISTKFTKLTELENNYIKQLEEYTLLQQQFDIITNVLAE